MLIILFFVYCAVFRLMNISIATNITTVGIIIFSQPSEYHEKLFQRTRNNILKQTESYQKFQVQIFNSYTLLDDEVGHWTLFPLLEKLATFKEFNWILFLEESTGVNLEIFYNVLEKYNSSEEVFVGYVLQDTDPTIIHHFADPASLLYPHFSAGFFISPSLVQRLLTKLPVDDEYSFSIDPKYEFAKFVWDSGNGVKLQHENQLCLAKDNDNCATWIEEEFPNCGIDVASDKLQIGVKTCHNFHKDRISVVKNTWASESERLLIFSDQEDKLISTIKVPIENVARGHCEKTLFIIKHYLGKDISLDWLAIVDDDTIISVKRLRKLLSCYNASDTLAIGERYGYGVANSMGYDYITGGGGMVFSLPTLKLLARYCQCPSIDSPDDMIIGMCLKRLGIPVIHSPYFHQARPTDYALEFLKPFKHISFHKHWMIDPYSVYQVWLQEAPDEDVHSEL